MLCSLGIQTRTPRALALICWWVLQSCGASTVDSFDAYCVGAVTMITLCLETPQSLLKHNAVGYKGDLHKWPLQC